MLEANVPGTDDDSVGESARSSFVRVAGIREKSPPSGANGSPRNRCATTAEEMSMHKGTRPIGEKVTSAFCQASVPPIRQSGASPATRLLVRERLLRAGDAFTAAALS